MPRSLVELLRLLLVGDGAIERLLTDVASLVEGTRPFEIAAGPHYLGARLRRLSSGGVHRRLERRTLKREQKSALLDVLAFLEDAAGQKAWTRARSSTASTATV